MCGSVFLLFYKQGVSQVLITFITCKCYHFTDMYIDHEMEHWKYSKGYMIINMF